MVVVHLRAHSAAAGLDLGAVALHLNHVFLAESDGQAAFKRLEAKVGHPDTWEPADYLDLAFLPFMRDPTRTQEERALWAAQLAEQLPEPINRYATAMIIGLTSTFVDPEVLNSLKEVIRMNRLVEELEAEALQRGLEQGIEEGLEKGLEKGLEQGRVMVTEILTQKFGPLPQDVLARLITMRGEAPVDRRRAAVSVGARARRGLADFAKRLSAP